MNIWLDKDLGVKQSAVEQEKFEYSPLGKVFTKGLEKDDQKEGLFKRLKDIEKKSKPIIMAKVNQVMLEVNRVSILPH